MVPRGCQVYRERECQQNAVNRSQRRASVARPTDRKEICTHLAKSGLFAAVIACSLLTGCEFIGGFTEPTTTSQFERSNPLQISKEKSGDFKVLVLAPLVGKLIDNGDVVYFSEGLAKTGRFKVLSPNELTKEASKDGANLRLMTQEDRKLFFKKVGKKISADAVLVLTGEEATYDPSMAEFIGRHSKKGKIQLTAFSSDSGDVIWDQGQFITISTGQLNRGTENQYRKALLDPLIAHFTSTFP